MPRCRRVNRPTVLLGALVMGLILPSCGKKDAGEDANAPRDEEVWEGEMVANPQEFEMTPIAPKEAPVEPAVPDIAVANPVEPEVTKPEVTKPEVTKPEVTKPEVTKPEVTKPEVTKLEVAKPEPKPEPQTVSPEVAEARVLLGSKAVDEKLLLADLDKVIESGKWNEYREQLKVSIDLAVMSMTERITGEKLAALTNEPTFHVTLLRWKMLKLFPPGLWSNETGSNGFTEFAHHVFAEPKVMEEVLMTVQPEDDVLKVLPMMLELWNSHSEKPELAAKYFNLNLACAVVFDEKLSLVNDESGSEGDYASGVDARTRYDWYVKQNERGYLEVSIDRSSARDLTFVVCAPVTEGELDWAVREYRSLRRKAWAKTYGDIKYLMERAVEGLDPYESYTLEEIRKEGGICGDQTYYCVNTARAAGIPALGLSGTTDAGPHAWAALKIDDEEWSTEAGRINGVSRGAGRDPQTGKTINEQDIWMWSSREYSRESRKLEMQRQLWMAQLFGELSRPEWQRMVVATARRDGEPYPEYWEVLYDSMKSDPQMSAKPQDTQVLKAWYDFCDALKREFKENPRMSGMAIQVEEEQLFPHMELADIRRQLDRDRRRQQREAAEQVDLVTTSLKREAQWIGKKIMEKAAADDEARKRAEEQVLTEISQLYDQSLREYGKSISGFQTMADDYFGFVKDDAKLAPKAVRDIELAFKRVVDTDSEDWFRAQAEVGLHKRICEMYRHVGEGERADVMERRLETQMERARRKAL